VKLHGLFTDGVVLQRDSVCPIWGTAEPGESLRVVLDLGNDKVGGSVTANGDGRFRYDFNSLRPGGPYTLSVGNVTVRTVYVGEVWLCAGQSNMELRLDESLDPKTAIRDSTNPLLHFFKVPKVRGDRPAADLTGCWQASAPDTAAAFSAVGYYFGRDLQRNLGVPVGLIQASWGGTAAEEWVAAEVLDAHPEHKGKARHATTLHNGMIAPLVPFAIKGVAWYQGESNAPRAEYYRSLFPLLIESWRGEWGRGDFPFLFVQLAPYARGETWPVNDDWARLREAQLLALSVPRTAMVVTTDVGGGGELHPTTKEPVGARLALAARAVAYREEIEYSGPLFAGMTVEGDKAIVSFTHVGKGLEVRGDTLTGFSVAGVDRTFHPAHAEVRGDTVVVWSERVAEPWAVRYGWANYPVVNLWNKDGLPASPFRTDDEPPPALASRVMFMAAAVFLLTGVVALARRRGWVWVVVSLALMGVALAGSVRTGQQMLLGLFGEVETVWVTRACLVFALVFFVLCHVRFWRRSGAGIAVR
jgi:sialate O-acetylesterase